MEIKKFIEAISVSSYFVFKRTGAHTFKVDSRNWNLEGKTFESGAIFGASDLVKRSAARILT